MNKAKQVTSGIRGAVCPSCGRDNSEHGNICTSDDCPGRVKPYATMNPRMAAWLDPDGGLQAAGLVKVQQAARFIVQSGKPTLSELTPEGWKEIEAPTMKEAAIIHLRASKPALADYPIMVYVSDGEHLHPNGAPMCVHGFLFQLNAAAAQTREEHIAHLSAKLRERGIPHSPAQYDSAGNCLTCGEADRCPGVHTFEEIQAAARRARL